MAISQQNIRLYLSQADKRVMLMLDWVQAQDPLGSKIEIRMGLTHQKIPKRAVCRHVTLFANANITVTEF